MKRDKVIAIIFIVVVAICIILYLLPTKATKDEMKFKKEYESINNQVNEKTNKKNRKLTIPEKNNVEYLTGKEMLKKMNNKDSFIVYFGFNDCPWCRSIIETLIETIKDNGVSKLYYVDIKEIRDKYIFKDNDLIKEQDGTKEYNKLLRKLGTVLSEYNITDEEGNKISTGEKRIYAPNVVGIKDGKAVIMRTCVSEKETNPYMKITASMIKDTKKQVEEIISKVY